MKNSVLTGCSSFNNRFWKGIFYPENLPASKWFEYYCEYFETYEFNGSFYKFPTVEIFHNWYKKAPENFLFSVKVHKEITHIKKFTNCKTLIEDFYSICKNGLKEKLGCILFQLPPSYQYSKERLHEIVMNLDYEFKNVIEFRHESWWNEDVWEIFLQNNITFCSVSYPNLPQTVFTEFPLIYIRFHGNSELFYSGYSTVELKQVKNKLEDKNAFVYFNNTAGTQGILNALEFKKI